MSSANTSVYAIYQDQNSVSEAVNALKALGFRTTDISILIPENVGNKDFGHQKSTKAPEGAVTGGGLGAAAGSLLGYFAGMGSLAVHGLEPFVAAGPLMGLCSGMGMGMLFGAVTGALTGATMPEYEAKRFSGRIRSGGILMSVHCDSAEWTKLAVNSLRKTGGLDIGTSSEAKADFAVSERPRARSHAATSTLL